MSDPGLWHSARVASKQGRDEGMQIWIGTRSQSGVETALQSRGAVRCGKMGVAVDRGTSFTFPVSSLAHDLGIQIPQPRENSELFLLADRDH
jgi:hypothetical protein